MAASQLVAHLMLKRTVCDSLALSIFVNDVNSTLNPVQWCDNILLEPDLYLLLTAHVAHDFSCYPSFFPEAVNHKYGQLI